MFAQWNKAIVARRRAERKITKVRSDWTEVLLEGSQNIDPGTSSDPLQATQSKANPGTAQPISLAEPALVPKPQNFLVYLLR